MAWMLKERNLGPSLQANSWTGLAIHLRAGIGQDMNSPLTHWPVKVTVVLKWREGLLGCFDFHTAVDCWSFFQITLWVSLWQIRPYLVYLSFSHSAHWLLAGKMCSVDHFSKDEREKWCRKCTIELDTVTITQPCRQIFPVATCGIAAQKVTQGPLSTFLKVKPLYLLVKHPNLQGKPIIGVWFISYIMLQYTFSSPHNQEIYPDAKLRFWGLQQANLQISFCQLALSHIPMR